MHRSKGIKWYSFADALGFAEEFSLSIEHAWFCRDRENMAFYRLTLLERHCPLILGEQVSKHHDLNTDTTVNITKSEVMAWHIILLKIIILKITQW